MIRSLVVLAACALLTTGCSGDDQPTPAAAPTRIADLDAARTDLARAAFCDLVDPAAVTAALGGASAEDDSWGNGDPAPTGGTDVAHELGCAWAREGGHAARAWVFARPVSAAFADEVIPTARSRGCTVTRTTTFGSPGLQQVCALPNKVIRVRLAGLFGDTWLTCEVAGPDGRAPVRQRVDPWCAQVAGSLEKTG